MKAIEFENIGKQYRLGLVSTGTISHDLNRWWTMNILHKEDPYLKIGETNDRSHKGESDYVWALKDINFSIEEGDVVGIIGKNGAGKSTLLKLLSQVTAPTTGLIKVNGRIASLLEVGTGFHPEMTGRENIYLNGAIMGMTKSEISRKLDEIVDFSGCERYIDTPVKRYSSGMTVRLGFAIAAHLEPEILVVDEVLAVGDAEFQKKAIGKMQDVSKTGGRTVLFVSHNMDSMLKLCKRGFLLENGQLVYEGTIESTVARYLEKSNSSFLFKQMESKKPVFINEVYFRGNDTNIKGSFSFEEPVKIGIKIKRNTNCTIENNTTVGICLLNSRNVMISIKNICIGNLNEKDELHFEMEYPSKILMIGTYYFHIAIHVPNVCFYDRQDTISFRILDKESDFIQYNGADNGIIVLNPKIERIKES